MTMGCRESAAHCGGAAGSAGSDVVGGRRWFGCGTSAAVSSVRWPMREDGQLELDDVRPGVVPFDAAERVRLARCAAKRQAYALLLDAVEGALMVPHLPPEDDHRLRVLLEPVRDLALGTAPLQRRSASLR